MNVNEIRKLAEKANGRRKWRTLDESDVQRFVKLFEENCNNEKIHTIRVYSSEGFVPRSYKWRAPISVLEARRTEEGFEFVGFVVDAKRGYGQGSLQTVNSRPA